MITDEQMLELLQPGAGWRKRAKAIETWVREYFEDVGPGMRPAPTKVFASDLTDNQEVQKLLCRKLLDYCKFPPLINYTAPGEVFKNHQGVTCLRRMWAHPEDIPALREKAGPTAMRLFNEQSAKADKIIAPKKSDNIATPAPVDDIQLNRLEERIAELEARVAKLETTDG